MGLLDSIGIEGPEWADGQALTQGLLALAKNRKRPFTGLLEALATAEGVMGQARDKDRAIAKDKLAQELLQAQIGETKAQAEQRMAAAEKEKQAVARQQAFMRELQQAQAPISGGQAMAGGGGPSVANAALLGQRPQIDWMSMALRNPDQLAIIEKLAQAKNLGRDEVAGQYDTVLPGTNLPATALRSKFGDQLGLHAKPVELSPQDRGGSIDLLNKYTGQFTPGVAKTNAPDALLMAEITRRGQNMTDARARDANAISAGTRVGDAEEKLRKEFEGLPEVKAYKQAFPSYAGIVDAAKRSNPMSDINMVYGLAKLYDPNSVVREGEYATVANAPNIPERIKGMAQYVSGGGKLTDTVKEQILAEAQSRIQSYQNEVGKAKKSYTGIAARVGLNPENIFANMGELDSSIGGTGWGIRKLD
jgi:hypothetical protein